MVINRSICVRNNFWFLLDFLLFINCNFSNHYTQVSMVFHLIWLHLFFLLEDWAGWAISFLIISIHNIITSLFAKVYNLHLGFYRNQGELLLSLMKHGNAPQLFYSSLFHLSLLKHFPITPKSFNFIESLSIHFPLFICLHYWCDLLL